MGTVLCMYKVQMFKVYPLVINDDLNLSLHNVVLYTHNTKAEHLIGLFGHSERNSAGVLCLNLRQITISP